MRFDDTLFGGVHRFATVFMGLEVVRMEMQETKDEWEDEGGRTEWRTQERKETFITCVDEMTYATHLSHAMQCESMTTRT